MKFLNVQVRREKDIVLWKMMKILMQAQKGPASAMEQMMLKTVVIPHKVQDQHPNMMLLIDPQIKVNKNYCLFAICFYL